MFSGKIRKFPYFGNLCDVAHRAVHVRSVAKEGNVLIFATCVRLGMKIFTVWFHGKIRKFPYFGHMCEARNEKFSVSFHGKIRKFPYFGHMSEAGNEHVHCMVPWQTRSMISGKIRKFPYSWSWHMSEAGNEHVHCMVPWQTRSMISGKIRKFPYCCHMCEAGNEDVQCIVPWQNKENSLFWWSHRMYMDMYFNKRLRKFPFSDSGEKWIKTPVIDKRMAWNWPYIFISPIWVG